MSFQFSSADPVIVSGLPRSGTSVMMQMLAAGGVPVLSDGVRVPDVDNPQGYFEFEPVKKTRQDPRWLQQAQGKAVKVVHLLLLELPLSLHYHVILMRRAIEEVLASQRTMLQRLEKSGAGLPDNRLSSIYTEQIETTRRWLFSHPQFRTLEVNYIDCVRNPVMTAAAVNSFLGGRLDEEKMVRTVMPSLYRNRSVRASSSGHDANCGPAF
jgi:hypothetical protein